MNDLPDFITFSFLRAEKVTGIKTITKEINNKFKKKKKTFKS